MNGQALIIVQRSDRIKTKWVIITENRIFVKLNTASDTFPELNTQPD